MLKKFLPCLLLFASVAVGQNNQLWQGYFSYNHITDLSTTATTLYASSENALFYKGFTADDITTINSIDGLKADQITAMYRSETHNLTFVGNKSGLLLVVNNQGNILQKRGIIDEVPVSPLIKKVNHFLENGTKIYISCDYGISVFDLTTMEFGETYYMGPSGANIAVMQTAVANGFIYAATAYPSGSGIRRANLSSPFLDDYSQWVDISGYFWIGVSALNNTIFALRIDNKLYRYDGTNFIQMAQYAQEAVDIRTSGNYLIVTTINEVFVYNQALQQIAHIVNSQVSGTAPTFTCATVVNDAVYIGTKERGIITATLSNPLGFQEIKPDGPFLNHVFRVRKSPAALWALYGRYNRTYNPYNPDPPYGLYKYPISKFTAGNGWDLIPYSDLFGAGSLSSLAFNPNNENELYVSSYHDGVLKVVDEVPVTLYNDSNTGSDGLDPALPPNEGIRVNGPVYDRNGNLWVTNNYVAKPLKVRRANGSWQSYDFSAIIPETNQECYGILAVDRNGTKWLPSSRNGLIAFNDQQGNRSMVFKTQTEGNLPDLDVRCVTVDNRNQLWIGTAKGLRIIQSVDQFLTEDDLQTRAIIIEEEINGEVLAQELFYDQFILDIAVDGANRKWVSIADSGVYLVSSNGQQTIYHFTKDNSPLPSNNTNDIEIDGVTGEVFFATDKGLVSFKGVSTKPMDDLSGVYVYPNPVRPEFTGTVKISGLTDKANVKIADIEGNLVYETTSAGGTIEWDTSAFGKYRVASGVYMIFIATQDGADTKVKKVMIVR